MEEEKEVVEEKELVARAQRGDSNAWEVIYKKHVPLVYKVILRMVTTTWIAEELTQDVFFRAFKGISGFRSESRLATWLHGIAERVAWTHLGRPQIPKCGQTDILMQFSDKGREAKSIEKSIELMQDIHRLEKAICSLPDAERTVIILHGLYEWSYVELAVLRGVTPGAVKKQYHDAIIKLRKEFTS